MKVWDVATSREADFRIRMLPGGEYAVLKSDGSGAIEVSPEAWRWLGWQVKDPKTGELTRLPAETFGPLPVRPHP